MDLEGVPVLTEYISVVVGCHMMPSSGTTMKSYIHIQLID